MQLNKTFYLLIILMFSFVMLPVHAQQSCTSAAADATVILDTALTLLENGNTEGATTLITSARDTLATCSAGDSTTSTDMTQPDTDPTAPPDAEATSEPTTEPATADAPETTGTGDYVLNQPDVDINSSIAFIRFAHTSVDAGTLDIYRGRDTTPIVAGLDYGEVTELIPIPAGDTVFTTQSSATGDELYRVSWNYLSNSSWVLTAAGVQETFAFIVEPISILRNDYNEQARVRFINLAGGAPRSTITTLEGRVLADGLGWIGIRDIMLEPGEHILDVATTDGAKLVTPEQFNFEANITYTIMVTGGLNDTPLQLLAFETSAEISRVRFINKRPDVIDIVYRPGNDLLIEAFASQTESDWYEFASGAFTFIATEVGAGAVSRELAALPMQLRPSRDLTIEITESGMQILDISLRGYSD